MRNYSRFNAATQDKVNNSGDIAHDWMHLNMHGDHGPLTNRVNVSSVTHHGLNCQTVLKDLTVV